MRGYNRTDNGRSLDSSSLAIATDGNVIADRDLINFTVEWTGYFYTVDKDGLWRFWLSSDDASYLSLGTTASSTSNCLVCNVGYHDKRVAGGNITLKPYTLYAIRISYGQSLVGYEMEVFFQNPSGTVSSNGNEYFYSEPKGKGFEISSA